MAKLIGVAKTTKLKKAPTFKEAQGIVGGYVEVVRLQAGAALLVNEDGLLKQLPLNKEASFLTGRTIVGETVLLETKADVKKTLGE